MPFKNIDNPWLIKTLIVMLTGFGVVFGTALGPLLMVTFNPDVQGQVDAYAQLVPTHWYFYGALGGGLLGFLIAIGTLTQLTRQAEQERKHLAAGDHAPAAH